MAFTRVFLTQLLQGASKIAKDHFGKVVGTLKDNDPNQVLTEADLAIGKFCIEEIQKVYPQHNIIDEETGAIDNGSPYTWVIDPIDGTSNFAAGTPLYGVMIGLLQEDKPVAGAVALPAFNALYIAEKGAGAFRNDQKIHVAEGKSLQQMLVSYGIDSNQKEPEKTRAEGALLAEIILNIRNLRTSNSVFDMMMVAEGRYGAVLNQTSKIWDNVAPQIILEEAGGVYTDFWGVPMNYQNAITRIAENYTFCTAPKNIHEELQRIIANKK